MTAATRQARLKADVVRNRNLGQMPPVNQFSQEAQPLRIVGHVDAFVELVIGRLHPEQIQLDHNAGVGQAKQALFVKDRSVDVADDGAGHVGAMRPQELRDLLRLIGMPARVDGQRRTGFPLCHHGRGHDPLFQLSPRRLATNLADHPGTHVSAPGSYLNLIDHFRGEVLNRPAMVCRCLILVHVIAAPHDDPSPRSP